MEEPPCRTPPGWAMEDPPCQTGPGRAMEEPPCRTPPGRAGPCRAMEEPPCQTGPGRAVQDPPCRAGPGRLSPPQLQRVAAAVCGRSGPEAVAPLLEALAAPGGPQDPEQRLWEAEHRERALHGRLARLEEQNQQLLGRLVESQTQEDRTAQKEREVMLQLKEVVDKQRDELRAQAHEIACKSRDMEALQEQLHRFMSMNEVLRHKVAMMQAQLKSALEQKSDLEAAMLQIQREMSRRSRTAPESPQPEPGLEGAPLPMKEPQHQEEDKSTAQCCFSKEELQQILQERNELKTNLFLVQEELAYYQRELLNEERIPSFFLDAMKSNIKKQRKKIRAKMLGMTEESGSSDEGEGSWLPGHSTDYVDAQPPESKIKSFFGLWYQGSSKDPPTSSCSGTWEIIDSLDMQLEPEGENKLADSSPGRAMAPL